jgi:hypothetical protein
VERSANEPQRIATSHEASIGIGSRPTADIAIPDYTTDDFGASQAAVWAVAEFGKMARIVLRQPGWIMLLATALWQ